MIQEIVQFQENDIPHIDPLVLDHLQSRVIDVKILVLDIVVVKENSVLIELYTARGTLAFITNEKNFRSPYYPNFRNNRYRFFSRSTSRN